MPLVGKPNKVLISEATAANNEILAAVTGKKLVLTACYIRASAACVLTWKDEDGNALSGAISLTAGDLHMIYPPHPDEGWLETTAGKGLHLTSNNTSQISGNATIVEVS